MFIDTHCHLNFKEYDTDRAMVIGNAKKAGVKKFINPGVDIYFSQQTIELAKKHQGVVFAGVGFHPYEASRFPDITALETLLRQQRDHIFAIGECGLDYHQYKGEEARGKKDAQKHIFEAQLELAARFGLPVIFHCREAFEDFFAVVDRQPSLPRGVMHCFGGGLQELRASLAHGFFVGIDGNVTYSKQLEFLVPHIPLGSLLLETDAPYLTPVPYRGGRNEPKYIPLVAKRVAELLNMPLATVEAKTTENASGLFRIS